MRRLLLVTLVGFWTAALACSMTDVTGGFASPAAEGGVLGDASTPRADAAQEASIGDAQFVMHPLFGPVFVPQGGSVDLPVKVLRADTFDAAVILTIDVALPSWLTVGPAVISAGETDATMRFTAALDAPLLTTLSGSIIGTSGTLASRTPISLVVTGQSGTLDSTFGLGADASADGGLGIATIPVRPLGGGAEAVRIDDTTGDIIVVGYTQTTPVGDYIGFAARFDKDGLPAPGLGDGGVVEIPQQSASLWVRSAADKSLLVGGAIQVASAEPAVISDAVITHISSTGQVDPAFGDGGSSVIPTHWATDGGPLWASFADYGDGALGMSAGCIGACGPLARSEIRMGLFGADGAPKTAFGDAGIVVVTPDDAGSGITDPSAVATTSSKGLAFAIRHPLPDATQAVVADIDVDGSTSPPRLLLDGGIPAIDCATLQNDGTIIAAQTSIAPAQLYQFGASGQVETSFTPDAGTSPGTGSHCIIKLGYDGSYFVKSGNSVYHFGLDGYPDLAFGESGHLPKKLANADVAWSSFAVQADGRVVAVGALNGGLNVVVARFWP